MFVLLNLLNTEAVWRVWAPETGAHMSKDNCFNLHWKNDFYGLYYNDLLVFKRKYNPTQSLQVISGVGSDELKYYLDSRLD